MLVVDGQVSFAPVIAALHQQCFERGWSVAEVEAVLRMPGTMCWLKEQGFLLCLHVLDEMEILAIGVLPAFRRHGIARRLLAEMTENACQNGVSKIFLEVSEVNQAAQALYAQSGFRQTGRRKGYYQTKEGAVDALCLTKILPENKE